MEIKITLFLILINIIELKSYIYEKIYSFENKTINLNSTKKYIIYELEHEIIDYIGDIYIYFSKKNNISINITVYYNDSKININEEKKEILDYDEQKILNNNSFLKFKSHRGNMYFIFSNFKTEFSDNIQLVDTNGYSDITNYDIFKYIYKFEPLQDNEDSRTISFSFKNNIKQKNYIHYQFFNEYSDSSGLVTLETNESKIRLNYDSIYYFDTGKVDISKFKNETINIRFIVGYSFKAYSKKGYFDYYEVLIFFSDYEQIYPLINNENSFSYIPSISQQIYYLFIDINSAYKKIFLTAKTKNSNFTGQYYFYESNNIDKIKNNLPYKKGIDIDTTIIEDNLFEIQINLKENYQSVLIKIETFYNDIEYRVNFFKSIEVIPFQNYSFILNEGQRFIIYDFINPVEYIYTYFQSYINSTFIYTYSSIYNICINSTNNIISGYDEVKNLNSTILKFQSNNEKIYLLITNFEDIFSNTLNIISPNGYSDITNNSTFQYFYQLPYFNNNIIFTLSFNNKIKNKNFLIYQIFNYQNEQIDNTQIVEEESSKNIPIIYDNYNAIVNLTNYKNGKIDLIFNISSKYEFNSIIILIYFSNYKNLYQVKPEYGGNFYIPCIKPNEFFIYVDISKINKNIFFIVENDNKNLSNKYYFHQNNDINEIYSNIPDDEYNFDGIYTSNLLDDNVKEIQINRDDKLNQNSLLLKMKIETNTNINAYTYGFSIIKPLQNKTINLHENKKFEIFEFNNEYNGTVYIYFTKGKIESTLVSVYYDMYNININEENEEILDFEEQQNLENKEFLCFKSYKGKMYFVISNFKMNYNDTFHIINNCGYSDISDYDIFHYFFKFDKSEDLIPRDISFSFKNDIKQKNYLNIQLEGGFLTNSIDIMTKTSKNNLSPKNKKEYSYLYDISNYKNETITIYFRTKVYKIIEYEILIFYSDYGNIYPLSNEENSIVYVPSIYRGYYNEFYYYYIFIDITNAYEKIYLNVRTDNNSKAKYNNFRGKYNFYESNEINSVIQNLPNTETGLDITYNMIEQDKFEAAININSSSYKSVLITMEVHINMEYRVNFFKSNIIYSFQNISFNLNENQKFIIYEFNNYEGDFIYAYFKNGNISSTYIFIYFDIYKIYINKANDIFLYYEDKKLLNSNILKFSFHKGKNYIVISNFEKKVSDCLCIINPYSYYDITQNQTIQYFYKIPNPENNIVITFSFNNKIKNTNFLYYQIYNYNDDQIDNTQIFERNSLNYISIDYYEYGGIVNLTNNKNDYVNLKFNVSSKNKFDSIILSISFSDYKNLYKISSDNNYYLFIPSTNHNEFFIYMNVSNLYKSIIFLAQTECKNLTNKYYYYNTDDINKIYLNLPDDKYNYDGIYTSNLIYNNLHEIIINKTNNNIQKSILLKMEIDTNINISLKVNYTTFKINPFENKTINLYENNRYAIYEFNNIETGIIYIYFSNGNIDSTKVSIYYDIYKININEEYGQILDFEEQKSLNKRTFLSFKSYIGKMYFVISNFNDDFSDIFYIINTNVYNDITNYDIFRYTYQFETTKSSNENIIIKFSFNNNIKQKNYIYYQINNNKYQLIDNTKIIVNNSDKDINDYWDSFAKLNDYKNVTINIIFNVSTLHFLIHLKY